MKSESITLITIPQEEWTTFRNAQQELIAIVNELKQKGPGGVLGNHITAKEFMTAVKIGRTKFDKLVQENKIKTIKKKRKIYLPVGEVNRYFTDADIR